MTDIVERLRQGIADRGAEHLMDEAAAEIERLQTANEYAFVELAKMRGNNEWLRQALQAIMDGEPNAAQLAVRALEPKP